MSEGKRPQLRLLDGSGEVHEPAPGVILPDDYASLHNLNVELRRRNTGLETQLNRLRRAHPQAKVVTELLDHWREACNHSRAKVPLDGKRWKVVAARLADYTPEQLRAAIDGYAAYPWQHYDRRFCEPGEGRVRRDWIERFFSDEVGVDKGLELAERVAGEDASYAAYKRLVWDTLQAHPEIVPVFAALAVGEPHGCVLTAAARWASKQGQGEPATSSGPGLAVAWAPAHLGDEAMGRGVRLTAAVFSRPMC